VRFGGVGEGGQAGEGEDKRPLLWCAMRGQQSQQDGPTVPLIQTAEPQHTVCDDGNNAVTPLSGSEQYTALRCFCARVWFMQTERNATRRPPLPGLMSFPPPVLVLFGRSS
jgi:hypothetical protein